ncbi:hypothetical protein Tco_1110691, partial [Tanacetum coccineum]
MRLQAMHLSDPRKQGFKKPPMGIISFGLKHIHKANLNEIKIKAFINQQPGSSAMDQITPTKDGNPLRIKLIDAKIKEPKDTLEVDVTLIATGKAPFTQGFGKFMSIWKHNVVLFHLMNACALLIQRDNWMILHELFGIGFAQIAWDYKSVMLFWHQSRHDIDEKVEQDILDFSKGLRVIRIKPTEKITLSADYLRRWLIADQGRLPSSLRSSLDMIKSF